MKHTQDVVGHLFVYNDLQKLLQKFSALQNLFLTSCMFFKYFLSWLGTLFMCVCLVKQEVVQALSSLSNSWYVKGSKKRKKKKAWKKCVLSKYLYQGIYCWIKFLNFFLLYVY